MGTDHLTRIYLLSTLENRLKWFQFYDDSIINLKYLPYFIVSNGKYYFNRYNQNCVEKLP